METYPGRKGECSEEEIPWILTFPGDMRMLVFFMCGGGGVGGRDSAAEK